MGRVDRKVEGREGELATERGRQGGGQQGGEDWEGAGGK